MVMDKENLGISIEDKTGGKFQHPISLDGNGNLAVASEGLFAKVFDSRIMLTHFESEEDKWQLGAVL